MIQIVNTDGTAQLESMLVITPDVMEAIQATPQKQVKALCKDLKISHRTEEKEGKDPISIVGMAILNRSDICVVCDELAKKHKKFLDEVVRLYEENKKEHDRPTTEEDKDEFEEVSTIESLALGCLLLANGLYKLSQELCE